MKTRIAALIAFAGFVSVANSDDLNHGQINFNCHTDTCTTFEAIIGFGAWISYAPFQGSTFVANAATAESKGTLEKAIYVQALKDDAAQYIVDPSEISVMLKNAIDQVRAQHTEAALLLNDVDLAAIILATP